MSDPHKKKLRKREEKARRRTLEKAIEDDGHHTRENKAKANKKRRG
jgi:hypothetical protein